MNTVVDFVCFVSFVVNTPLPCRSVFSVGNFLNPRRFVQFVSKV